jgi:hypothetical protein
MKLTRMMLLAVAALVICGAPAMAFHDAGVAHCNGCHTMHNSQDGVPVDPDNPNGNAFLLEEEAPSDVCLGCHATGLGAVFGDDELAPPPMKGGGNFVFLLEDNLNDGHAGASNPISGDAAGHNIISLDKGVAQDATLSAAPGGTVSSEFLACSSCHDPHGNQNFRMLYGAERTGFNPAPLGAGISLFFGSESATNHTAYNDGWSDWCGSCHGNFHDEAGGRLEHPSGSTLGGTIATNYNLYNGSDDTTGGAQATAYLAEVPYEGLGVTTSSTNGPQAASEVMCMTCHRAHASSAPDSGRWDFSVTFLDEDGHESGSYKIPSPYATLNQRSLCNKCHVQDTGDGPLP